MVRMQQGMHVRIKSLPNRRRSPGSLSIVMHSRYGASKKALARTEIDFSRDEKAARQQGGLFFRENSSNGGKAIRTFWRNTMFGGRGCQGKILTHLTLVNSNTCNIALQHCLESLASPFHRVLFLIPEEKLITFQQLNTHPAHISRQLCAFQSIPQFQGNKLLLVEGRGWLAPGHPDQGTPPPQKQPQQ